jgi:hypothetical protein
MRHPLHCSAMHLSLYGWVACVYAYFDNLKDFNLAFVQLSCATATQSAAFKSR